MCRPGKQQPVERRLAQLRVTAEGFFVLHRQLDHPSRAAAAGKGLLPQRFGPATGRCSQVPAQETDHRVGNIESTWVGGEFLDGDSGADQVQREVTEIMAWEDAARSIAEAQAAEVDARLRIVEARDAAGQAVTDSDRVRSEAAAVALRALTNAGLVEAAAAHEALEALEAAGLLIAAADEAADVAVAAAITPAELRVLRYLPTKLTFALIADKLGISRGAAKNRAERAYKKLGVHTRADAVTRAHTLRILP